MKLNSTKLAVAILAVYVGGIAMGAVVQRELAPSPPPTYIDCPDPVVVEDDMCVVVPLWAVDSQKIQP